MRAPTHLLFSALLLTALARYQHFSAPNFFLLVAVLAVATLGADLDHPSSPLGRRAPWIGWMVGHRTLFHSAWFVALLAALLWPAHQLIALGFVVGWGGHLLLDAFTRSGIAPLWPLPWRIRGPVRVGGATEWAVFLGLAGLLLWVAVYQ